MSDFGSPLFARLREEARADWDAYVDHEFVRALGRGDLPEAAFLRYLRQDYLFLVQFARAWSLLAFKAGDAETMREAARVSLALVETELELHVALCAEEGIDRAALAGGREAPWTVAYTRYVIDAGLAGDELDLIVALTPCVLGYAEIGRKLAAGPRPADRRFAAWIDAYAGPDYGEAAARDARLLERAAARRIGPATEDSARWPALAALFAEACRLEAAFWEGALGAER
ncbi:MAG: TenA family protein [Pikeienuella sp.]|uniref:TenA family protein n=1 Tax=Pikeienuella sp. TaxID=2831957 RepID=UPI00391AEE3A